MSKIKRTLLALVAAMMMVSLIPAAAFATTSQPADDPIVFTVYSQEGPDATPTVAKAYTQAQFDALPHVTTPVGYLAWNTAHDNTWQVYGTANAIKFSALISDAGLLFQSGYQVTVTASDDFSQTFGYQDIQNANKFYPATTATTQDVTGSVTVDPVIAISGGSSAIADTAANAVATAAAGSSFNNRFLIGLTDANYNAQTAAGKRFVNNTVSVTVIKTPPISGFKIFTQVGDDANSKSLVKDFSRTELLALAKTTPAGFLMNRNNVWSVHASNLYIPLADLLAAAKVTFNEGDSLKPMAADGFGTSFNYAQIQAGQNFYPATTATTTDTTGVITTGAVLALDWGSANISGTASNAVTTALTPAMIDHSGRFYIGLSETDYLAKTAAGNRFVTAPVEITITKAFEARSLEGDDRYETAAVSAQAAYPDGAETVILAYGKNYPDALSASSLAGLLDAPILLTDTDALAAGTSDALAALKATKVVIVGGTTVISATIENNLKSALGETNVSRLAGDDRYATNLAIYNYGKANGSWGKTAIIASGAAFPDALSVAPYAFSDTAPIFLADPTTGLTAAISTAITADKASGALGKALIAGGASAVSANTADWLTTAFGAASVTRLAGNDRYGTSDAIAKWLVANAGFSWNGSCIASGVNFPDALTGSVVAAKKKVPLFLASSGNTSVLDNLSDNKDAIKYIHFLGGTSAVPQDVRDLANSKLGWS
jgi:putative cell wall-binding protein